MEQSALILGCGDTGLRLARRLAREGREVTGIVRSQQSAAALAAAGVVARALDLDRGDTSDLVAPLVFWFAPPPASGTAEPRLRRWLGSLPRAPRRIVYISTSGVYGDCQGRWIDESESIKPQTDRARRRADAEQALRDFGATHGSEIVILRVPGIYGPGRLPVERLRAGTPVIRPEEAPFSNRVHADDLAAAAQLAAARGRAGAAYNISDGHPTTMSDYFTRCAALLGLPPPPTVSLAEARERFTPAMWSFVEESKRLSIARAVAELGFSPRYPDLARGLPACLPAPLQSPGFTEPTETPR